MWSTVECEAEAIRTTVVPIMPLIRMKIVPIRGIIGPTVVRVADTTGIGANTTGIGYQHDRSMRFSNKLTRVFNYQFPVDGN